MTGTYTFQLQATDSMGLSSSSTTQVVVLPPVPPTVNAGNNISLTYPLNSVKVQASVIPGSSPVLSTLWTEVSGPGQADILTPDSAGTLINNLVQGSYVFQITIIDSLGFTEMSTLQVDILPAIGPSVSAGTNQSIAFPMNMVILNGNAVSGSSPIISTSWNQISGPASVNFSDPGLLLTSVTNLIQGTYIFQLYANDSLGLSAVSTVQITVTPPLSPIANAGPDQTIIFPQNASLNGKDTAGSSPVLSVEWSQNTGPSTVVFADATKLTTPVTNLIPGTYIFQLTVTDSLGLVASSFIHILVQPAILPAVDAGVNQTIALPLNSVTLSGSITKGSCPVVSSVWTERGGPGSATITNPLSTITNISNLVQGRYVFQLTAVDSLGNNVYDSAVITVNQAPPSVINVRIYAGVAPFKNSQWNNWNVGSGIVNNLSSGFLNYSDGTASQIKTILSYQDNIGDNGTNYTTGATMCPDTAIRFSSYATVVRTLTFTGLNNSKKYNISCYASRSRTDGQKTIFNVGSQSVTVNTDNNSTIAANLTNLTPSQGNIVVTFSRVSTYNYINGFSISEVSTGGTSGLSVSGESIEFSQPAMENDSFDLKIFPNPVSRFLIISPGNGDLFDIELISMNGQIIKKLNGNTGQAEMNMNGLPSGIYIIIVENEITKQIFRKKIIKY